MLKIAMVECLVESSVECQVGSSANTHPTSNPLHKDVSDDLGWVLTSITNFPIKTRPLKKLVKHLVFSFLIRTFAPNHWRRPQWRASGTLRVKH